jgi:hypothetical protein
MVMPAGPQFLRKYCAETAFMRHFPALVFVAMEAMEAKT